MDINDLTCFYNKSRNVIIDTRVSSVIWKMYALDSTSVYSNILTIQVSILPSICLIVVGEGTDEGRGRRSQFKEMVSERFEEKISLLNNLCGM